MKLHPARCAETAYVNNNWTITVETGVTLENILEPEFLSNMASQMHPYDRICVRTDDGDWYAELLILSCGRTWVKAIKLMEIQLTPVDVVPLDAEGADKYRIMNRGPHLQFCVIRKVDGATIKEQLPSRLTAQNWLQEFLKT
jgi:hypothetical protein